ncbi:DUF4952 domain-containing protein [Achromobacter insuavis]
MMTLTRWLRTLLLPAVLLLPSAAALAQAAPTPGCEDFLAALGDKPESIEYQGCRQELHGQGKPLVARYRLDGAAAVEVERYLRQRFDLQPLHYRCCGWEAPPQSWRDPRTGRDYLIVFASEETLVSSRARWDRIDNFHIRVELYTEAI